jgi:polar amino acid transport system substrate-binding protein
LILPLVPHWISRLSLTVLALGACCLSTSAAEPIRAGLSLRSKPCTFFADKHWQGSVYEIWTEVAVAAKLPFEVVTLPTFRQLLEAGKSGQVDVAVGCINMTEERLAQFRFSVPIQEDGISVLVRKQPFQTWLPIVRTLWSWDLLGLLSGILAFIGLVTWLIWHLEGYAHQDETQRLGRVRAFARIFQILLTGPGTNALATTVRGNSLIGLVYFVRIVAASVLVSFVTVNIIQRSNQEAASSVKSIEDLAGKVVAAGPGSVSEQWLVTYNAAQGNAPKQAKITIKSVDNLIQAGEALLKEQVDAVVADNVQIQYYLAQVNPRAPLRVAISDIHRQSQGFVFAPQLTEDTALRINQAIARLKENGVIEGIRRRWLPDEE